MRDLVLAKLAETWADEYVTKEHKAEARRLALEEFSEKSDQELLDELLNETYRDGADHGVYGYC